MSATTATRETFPKDTLVYARNGANERITFMKDPTTRETKPMNSRTRQYQDFGYLEDNRRVTWDKDAGHWVLSA
jgi:hypothetical protein